MAANLRDLGRDPPNYKGLAALIVDRNRSALSEEDVAADIRRELEAAHHQGRRDAWSEADREEGQIMATKKKKTATEATEVSGAPKKKRPPRQAWWVWNAVTGEMLTFPKPTEWEAKGDLGERASYGNPAQEEVVGPFVLAERKRR
jgi:hypothetical protein